jgi:alanine racemase
MNKQNTNSIRSAVGKVSHTGSVISEGSIFGEYSRPAWIEIDLSALKHNIAAVKSKINPETRMMAVVKANAYGHGAVEVSRAAYEEEVDYLGVALLEEADEIKNAGIDSSIVILYPENIPRSLEAVKRGHIITVSDIKVLESIADVLKDQFLPIRYFLSVNTGMNRYGTRFFDEPGFFESIPNSGDFQFLGFATNLAGSNGGKKDLSDKQEDSFRTLMKSAKEYFGEKIYYSFESSGSVSNNGEVHGTLIRVGHLLYGPLNSDENGLRPVMTVKSRIAEIQEVRKGEGVGYGFSFIADRDMRIAVIPLGYADGYPWSLSNQGHVLTGGEIAPVVGRVCMDAFMIDISNISDCETGHEVVLLGSAGGRIITAGMLGEWAGSFSYEILSRWSRRLPRIYR